MSTETPEAPPSQMSSFRAFLILCAAGGGAILLGLWIKSQSPQGSRGGLEGRPFSLELSGGVQVGRPFPKINAEGWLNGAPPKSDDLRGKVVVVDIWATTCLPCRMTAPHLVALNKVYGDRVVFIGLTAEDSAFLNEIHQFLDETKITWLNGYGAVETMLQLDTEFIPRVWVIGRDGKVVWNQDSQEPIEDAIEDALQAPAQAT